MTNAEVILQLREIYNLSVTNYPDATLEKFITKACEKISEYYPERCIAYFDTVAEQSRYTISPTGLLKIKEVFYDLRGGQVPSSINSDFGYTSTYAPSQLFEFIKRIETFRHLLPCQVDIISNDTFDLLPTPTTVEKIYYEYAKFRTVDKISRLFIDEICELCLFYFSEQTYAKTVTNSAGNTYNFDRRGNNTVNSEQSSINVQKAHMEQLKVLEKKIKQKVNML